MFLVKAAFWLSVVIVLLPAGDKQAAAPGAQFGAADAASAASATVADMRQFCSRQRDACAVGSQAAAAFGQKAQAGAKMLYEFLSDRLGANETGSAASRSPDRPAAGSAIYPSQHTLTPADLAPTWRGPQPHKEIQAKRPA